MTRIVRRVITEVINTELLEEVQVIRDRVVYFLLLSEEIVYVGQSVNVHSVISRHQKKEFDQLLIKRVSPEDDLDLLEEACIVYFRPKFNRMVHLRKIPLSDAERIVRKFLELKG